MLARLCVLLIAAISLPAAAQTAQTAPLVSPPVTSTATAPAPAITLETVSPGTGATPADGDVVLVDYRGTLSDGTMFDEGSRVLLPVARLIPGFTQGLKQMRVGGSYRLSIPAPLGYGDRPAGTIPPNSDLVFTISLIDTGPPERVRTMQGLPDIAVVALTPGTGRTPTPEEMVLVTYTGRLADGTVFDEGPNALFRVDQLVPGFAQGLQRMRVGGRYRLTIPADLAYGASGAGPIPPNSDLTFDVELIASNRMAEIGAMMRGAAAAQ